MNPDPLERLIQAADIPVEPDPEFADALLKTLLVQLTGVRSSHEEAEKTMNQTIALKPSAVIAPSGPGRWGVRRHSGPRERSLLLSYAATAALLLLTLLGGLFATSTGRNLGILHQSSPGVEDELIASADIETVPADYLTQFTGISHLSLAPGASVESGPDTVYGDGIYLFEVVSGQFTITVAGPAERFTGDDDEGDVVPEGADAEFVPGDRGVLWPGTVTTWRNDGQEPAMLLIAAVGEAVGSVEPFEQVDLVKSFSTAWPESPATFALHRLTFEPDASLPVADLPGLMLIGIESGEIDVPLSNPDGSTRDRGFGTLEGFVATDWDLAPDGDLHNSGTETAVIYVLLGESTGPAATPEA